MEEVDTITVAVSGIDINKVEPLDTRRLCESKLDRMQQQLHRVECRLKLLECKLASIPGIPNTPTAEAAAAAASSTTTTAPVPGPSNSNNSKNTSTSSATLYSAQGENTPSTVNSNPTSAEINHNPSYGEGGVIPTLDKNHSGEEESVGVGEDVVTSANSARDDPRYVKYFKMVTVGVPVQAVKQKMLSEGMDPSVLDH